MRYNFPGWLVDGQCIRLKSAYLQHRRHSIQLMQIEYGTVIFVVGQLKKRHFSSIVKAFTVEAEHRKILTKPANVRCKRE